jgi:cytochrome c oxidase subunit 3
VERPGLEARASATGLLEPPVERPRRGRQRRSEGEPPRDRGGDGRGDGGRGGGGDGEGAPAPGPARRPSNAAELAFVFVLIAIGSLFLSFLLAYLMMWWRASEWPPPGAPRPPAGLWISTLLLAASSFALHAAGRAQAPARRRRAYALTLALGLCFLGAQAWLWRDLLRAGLTTDANAYGTLFYSLTGLHAVHVVAGLVFLAVVIALRQPARGTRRMCAIYWHFMGALWLVLFGVLYFV